MGQVRLRLNLAYDGGAFHGWASQPGLRTVQGELEEALRTLLRRDVAPVTGAGRTDTGVHARGQVVHLDTSLEELRASAGRVEGPLTDALARRLNGVLGEDVRVHGVREAAAGFDARFSALWRRYAYRVADAPSLHDPLLRGHVLTWPRRLDLAAMNEAAAELTGEHDFAAYCKRREGATTIRELRTLVWERDNGGRAVATVRADAFCHSMVRSLVGALLAVGEGRRAPSWPAQVLSAEVRDSSVLVVPAHGLCLEEVAYPPDHQLADRATETRVVRTRG